MAADNKTPQTNPAKPAKKKSNKPSFGERFSKVVRDYKSEFKKISWPTWKFTVKQSTIVIIAIIIIGGCIFVLDTSFSTVLQWIGKIV